MGANVYPPPGTIKTPIQSGIIAITASNTSNTATVSPVSSKAILILLGSGGTSASAGDVAGYLSLTNSTTVTAFRSSTGGTCNVSWQLVDYY